MWLAIRYFAVALVALGCLTFADGSTAQPKKTTKSQKKTTSRMHRNKAQFKNQVLRRKPGQRVFVVQARKGGWGRSGLMTAQAAVVTRNRLRSRGFSAHIHNRGSQGAWVHYNQGQWRSQAMFANRQAANQAATLMRAKGFQARIVTR